MVRFVILLLVIGACAYCYQNFDMIKSKTINSIQNEKTIKSFNIEKQRNEQEVENALKF